MGKEYWIMHNYDLVIVQLSFPLQALMYKRDRASGEMHSDVLAHRGTSKNKKGKPCRTSKPGKLRRKETSKAALGGIGRGEARATAGYRLVRTGRKREP